MAPYSKLPEEIIGDNIHLLDKDALSADERRLVQLYELAKAFSRSYVPGKDDNSQLFNGLFSGAALPENVSAVSFEYLCSKNNVQILLDKITVCKFLVMEYEGRHINISEQLLGGSQIDAAVKIAYFKNAYADTAFRVFSSFLKNPSVVYLTDFNSVCEEVYYGRADLCMLPLDSSKDAKLISFYRLIDKYELNPVFSCDVTALDGSVTTRYVLLRRSIALPGEEYKKSGGSCFFEFSFVPDEKAALGDILLVAEECGLSTYKVDSIPLTYSDSQFAFDIIINAEDSKKLDAFVLFLDLAVPQYKPMGIYPHIFARIGK